MAVVRLFTADPEWNLCAIRYPGSGCPRRRTGTRFLQESEHLYWALLIAPTLIERKNGIRDFAIGRHGSIPRRVTHAHARLSTLSQLSHSAPRRTNRHSTLMAARDEKDILMAPFVQAPRYHRSKWTALGLVALLASGFAVVFLHADIAYDKFLSAILSSHNGIAELCPQSDALYPESHAQLWKGLGHDYDEEAFLTRAVAWLGGAVRIPYVILCAFCCVKYSETPTMDEGRNHTMTWVLSVRTSGGRLSGPSRTISCSHSLSRAQ